MLTISRIKSVVTKIAKKYGVERVYLFGSYARGDATEKSDVDILIDKGEIRSLIDLSGFQLELSDSLDRNVDVVTTAGANKRFYDLINNDKVLLYES